MLLIWGRARAAAALQKERERPRHRVQAALLARALREAEDEIPVQGEQRQRAPALIRAASRRARKIGLVVAQLSARSGLAPVTKMSSSRSLSRRTSDGRRSRRRSSR